MGIVVHLHLFDRSNSAEADVVLVVTMAKSIGKTLPSLETAIDAFMPSSGTVHKVLVRVIFGSILGKDLGLSAVTLVGNDPFSV